MAVTAKLYGKLFENQFGSAAINWSSDTIKVMLVTSSYTFDQDTHGFKNDITNEVSGTGYTAGGATLGSKTATYTSGTNTCAFDAADTVWSSSTITARGAVVYKDTGTASTSPLIAEVDFGADVASSGGAFTITWDSAGIWSLAAA